MATTLADQAKHNGGGDGEAAVRDGRRGALPSPVCALVGDALSAVKKLAS
jgi:hypothetical protein